MLTARDHYEHGLTSLALRDLEAAIASLQAATNLKPGMSQAWTALADALQQSGDAHAADIATQTGQDTAAAAEPLRPPRTLSGGKLDAAIQKLDLQLSQIAPPAQEDYLRERLHGAPTDIAAMAKLTRLFMDQRRYRHAERLALRAVEIAPHYLPARHMLAVMLFRRSRVQEALHHAEHLVAHEPRNIDYRMLLAETLALVSEFGRAIKLYEALVRDAPKQAPVWQRYGYALRSAGRREEAVQAFRKCLSLTPSSGEAYWNLANLKTEPFTAQEIDAMEKLAVQHSLPAEDKVNIHYALGRALEQASRFEQSFTHYATGANLRRAALHYNADDITNFTDRAIDVFTPDFFARAEQAGNPDPAPIFILGMPRAGSTLLEQILASHSAVEGTAELPEIIAIARDLGAGDGAKYPASLTGLHPEQFAALGTRYLDATRPYRKTGKPFFIDKMPGNWQHAGLIRAILPNAKIIDSRRHPMATCFGAFKQLFMRLDYTYDLKELGRYYKDYARLMTSLAQSQPDAIHEIHYENLVNNLEPEIRNLLNFCNLPFEPACLRFWETTRPIHTMSSEQVRSPLFRQGLNQWRHYEPWLAPLKEALEKPA